MKFNINLESNIEKLMQLVQLMQLYAYVRFQCFFDKEKTSQKLGYPKYNITPV